MQSFSRDRCWKKSGRSVSISLDKDERFWLIFPEDLTLAKLQWGARSQANLK